MNALLVVRWLPLAAFCLAALLGWLLLAESAATMQRMDGRAWVLDWMLLMMRPAEPLPYLAASLAMWALMMLAMMVPAVLPLAVTSQRVGRPGSPPPSPAMLVSGYLLAWLGFCVLASLAQWLLHRAGWLHGMDMALGSRAAGGVLVAAGVYQLTPFKDACLTHCRSPLGFLLAHWQPGPVGALRMGLRHGLYCLGCCWLLMLLMFAGGTMSVATMAALTVLILAERTLPAGLLVSWLPGTVLLAWGGWLLLA